ncbi:MAG: enoyl-CoA hydratase/isomerase family protein [Actinobacteria bacterium]|nr:enoyl-CoA hydratase/isomerase family protein [Actinomycetota bacterium]
MAARHRDAQVRRRWRPARRRARTVRREPAGRGDDTRSRHHPPAEPRARARAAARGARGRPRSPAGSRRDRGPVRAGGRRRGEGPVTRYVSVDGLRVEASGSVLRLQLDRPDKRNAVDDEMMRGLIDNIEAASTDDSVRAIVLRGSGEHFCGGADIVARNAASGEQRPRVGSIQRRVPTLAHRLVPLVCSVQTPIVCRVQGWAAGIGFQLAVAADFTIAASDATFWEPFSQRGFTPDSGATWLLPRRVGAVRARELLLLGRRLTGREAADWGLVHRAVDAGKLDGECESIVAQLAGGPTVALGLTKWLLHAAESETLDEQLHNEALALELSSRSDDFREGLKAFREKRDPDFTGR